MVKDGDIVTCASAKAWETWLSRHHAGVRMVWVRIARKGAALRTVTYDEALEAALCYGWIDGQRKSHDEESFLQKFTPRRPRSLWSKRNVAKVAELIEAGRMRPPGLAEVEAAKGDGRWERAYDSSKDMVIPPDFLAALEKEPKAAATFRSLNRSELFLIGARLQTARTPEMRARRIDSLVRKLADGRKPA